MDSETLQRISFQRAEEDFVERIRCVLIERINQADFDELHRISNIIYKEGAYSDQSDS